MENKTLWKIITVVELVVAAAVVLLDLFIPTLVILGMIFVSLLIRREHIRSLGFRRPQSWPRMVGFASVGVVFLQMFDVGVVLPIMNRLTGSYRAGHHRCGRFLFYRANLRSLVRTIVSKKEHNSYILVQKRRLAVRSQNGTLKLHTCVFFSENRHFLAILCPDSKPFLGGNRLHVIITRWT